MPFFEDRSEYLHNNAIAMRLGPFLGDEVGCPTKDCRRERLSLLSRTCKIHAALLKASALGS